MRVDMGGQRGIWSAPHRDYGTNSHLDSNMNEQSDKFLYVIE
jgi:hypothetical protein